MRRASSWPRSWRARTRRADVRVEWADGSAPAFYDVVVRTTPHRRGPAYVVDPCGVLVVQAEHDKTWGLDALVQPGCRFVPLAVETAGRWGPAAVAELLALARGYEAAGAPADGESARLQAEAERMAREGQ